MPTTQTLSTTNEREHGQLFHRQHPPWQQDRKRKVACPPLFLHSDDHNNSDDESVPESTRRRQLLYSLLTAATAGGGSATLLITGPSVASAAEDAGSSTTTIASTPTQIDWSTISVIKPPLDDRDYKLTVLENGLRVILCSDPESNEAGAAMDVHVGACSDSKEIPGLAHFNEHM
ncbi:MAG: hypothetical protein SGARI_003079, partial [Bacillariaceae sp.]